MEQQRESELQLSIVMPCLNEENTVGLSVMDAITFMRNHSLLGEVIVVDNGSEDTSAKIARKYGAKIVSEKRIGYGRALRTGIEHARGKIIIMGDCDTTYDFLHLEAMYKTLSTGGFDVVIGNRYAGGIEKGAMPLVRRLGARFLSYCGRKRYGVSIYDFHCGLRGFTREAYDKIELTTEGMEFATELIAEAARRGLALGEIPVPLKRCEQKRKSKLRIIRDGMRHLLYMFQYKADKKN